MAGKAQGQGDFRGVREWKERGSVCGGWGSIGAFERKTKLKLLLRDGIDQAKGEVELESAENKTVPTSYVTTCTNLNLSFKLSMT